MAIKLTKTQSVDIDPRTGEILQERIEHKVQNVSYEQEPEFIKIYIHALTLIHGLKGVQANILLEIAKRMTFAAKEQKVVIVKEIRKDIALAADCSEQYVADTITHLVKCKLLQRCGTAQGRSSTYTVNPIYIAKGKWSEIKELQIVFNKNTKSLEEAAVNAVYGDKVEQIEQGKVKQLPRKQEIDCFPLFPDYEE